MKLEDYILSVIAQSRVFEKVEFEINLYSDATVADEYTGNKAKFTLIAMDWLDGIEEKA